MNNEELDLLCRLYATHSPTGSEWQLISLIRQYVASHLPEVNMRMDSRGNLYLTKGDAGKGYPTLACHLDQVQTPMIFVSSRMVTSSMDGLIPIAVAKGWELTTRMEYGCVCNASVCAHA